jgi:pilus assembly protein CpaF
MEGRFQTLTGQLSKVKFWNRPTRVSPEGSSCADNSLPPFPSRIGALLDEGRLPEQVNEDLPLREFPPAPADATAALRQGVYRQLRSGLPPDVHEQDPATVRQHLARHMANLLRTHDAVLDWHDQQAVMDMVLDDLFGLGPLGQWVRDAEVSDILVNGPFQVFIEKGGRLQSTDSTFDGASHLLEIIQRMVAQSGRRLDASCPMVDARLPDGSRMNAVLNPPAINGPLLSIRRFGSRPLTAEDLINRESLTHEMLRFLAACVRCRMNLVISGGTGSGKTTLLNALSRFIRPSERIATIEDTAELEIQQPHVVKMEARSEEGEVTIRDLVRNTLRIRPDRIIVGECRGAEALEMLSAMNTGHAGSMTTIHANSPREALSRMETMISLAGVDIPLWALRKQISSSIHFVVQISRQVGGQRKVVCISEVTGMEEDIITMHDIFHYLETGVENEVTTGHFAATGMRPVCYERLIAGGAQLSPELFAPRPLAPGRA